jgi:hypothetical protein
MEKIAIGIAGGDSCAQKTRKSRKKQKAQLIVLRPWLDVEKAERDELDYLRYPFEALSKPIYQAFIRGFAASGNGKGGCANLTCVLLRLEYFEIDGEIIPVEDRNMPFIGDCELLLSPLHRAFMRYHFNLKTFRPDGGIPQGVARALVELEAFTQRIKWDKSLLPSAKIIDLHPPRKAGVKHG